MGLHMNGGEGESSYASNSLYQRTAISKTKERLEEAVGFLCSVITPKTMNIADLGCGSGQNSLVPVNIILEAVKLNCGRFRRSMPEFSIFLNDLPENDFNIIFKIIPAFVEKLRAKNGEDFESCFFSGIPGSFYGRLFPSESLHFVYSSSSLHWLSQVPSIPNAMIGELNKGNIALGMTSPSGVYELYLEQFKTDFLVFLKSRSKEIIAKGCMVLSFMGRRTKDPFDYRCLHSWDAMAEVLLSMVKEGIIEEEKMETFNMPFYEPHIEEVRNVIQEEGSFDIIQLEWSDYFATECTNKIRANSTRAVTESMLSSHFGSEIIDELFKRFEENISSGMIKNAVIILLSLTRKEG